ncbi:hypothetical protein EYZ11_008821 [Aspergillus tanneri]|uniref:Uncharacterized protein n=1 Tax=Aspergillus tanneri TaxID=1220188 RepID=A0A4S3JBN2_9EURO|nr:hypothetical protein EYZ11_008821 [Aspergillus tanneri]
MRVLMGRLDNVEKGTAPRDLFRRWLLSELKKDPSLNPSEN